MSMRLDQLILRLQEIKEEGLGDAEGAHIEADALLLQYIDNKAVAQAYDEIEKWYG